MKARLSIITVSVCATLFAAGLLWPRGTPALPRYKLGDGTEFRVIQVRYTPHASEQEEHNIGSAPRAFFWIWDRFPSVLQTWVPYPQAGIGYTASQYPAMSIWWARIDPRSNRPLPTPRANVVMNLDSGDRCAVYASDGAPEQPHYRQIWVHEPPSRSKHLAFRVDVGNDVAHFTLPNPGYHP